VNAGEDEVSTNSALYRAAFIEFMYNASPVPSQINLTEQGAGNDYDIRGPQSCFIGMDGLYAALDQLDKRLQGVPTGITAYLSLEHSRILREPSAAALWERLWRLSGETPIRLVFDSWADADEAMKTLRGLLPYMQNGRLQLYLIKSTQKFFFSNASFYVEGIGIILTAEPAGGLGDSVSMFVESPDYIKGMGNVFARFDKIIKPIEKHLNMATTKDEAVYYSRLFERGGDVKSTIDGVCLLYMDSGAYMKLLKMNGVTGSQRAYRLDRFLNDKRQYEAFLEDNRADEILSVPALDRMITTKELKTPDFSFFSGTIRADAEILANMLIGMSNYLKRYGSLSINLSRREPLHPDLSVRLKSDSFVLLHSYEGGAPHTVWSDTWLLVYEYIRQYDEALNDDSLITTRDAVLAALRIRLESLGVPLTDGNAWEPEATQLSSRLSRHADAGALVRLAAREAILIGGNEDLARSIHEDYCKRAVEKGADAAPNMKPWELLTEDVRDSNRAQARSISEKLNMIGCAYDAGDAPYPSVQEFDGETILLLAQTEHLRWMNERFAVGWAYGEKRDDAKKIHPMLVQWDYLPEDEKQKNAETAQNIIPLLRNIGLRVYKTI